MTEKENNSLGESPELPAPKVETPAVPAEDDVLVPKEPDYSQDFRPTAFCARCRRDYTMRMCITRPDTMMTEMQIICPRCKKKLKRFRLKEWYEHYVQNESPPPKVSDGPVEPHDH